MARSFIRDLTTKCPGGGGLIFEVEGNTQCLAFDARYIESKGCVVSRELVSRRLKIGFNPP